jgi:DNA-binding NtrC family response regulator
MSEVETDILTDPSDPGDLLLPGLKLTVVEGPDQGRETTAKKGVVRVGTSTSADLVLTDGAVSRRHFEVRQRAGDVRVRDLDSTNGTVVDGVRVFEAVLPPGALIRVGTTAIRVTPVQEPIVVPLSKRERFGGLLGRSTAMRQAFAVLERVAPTEATVLIEGETGTGKELAAEAIHNESSRAEGPFVAVDCGAIVHDLVESHLFGHVRGSFTGAVADKRGAFEEAEGGTLFLDEIGELPLDLQPKLLRALEKRAVQRVGETRPRPIDVRVVAATNRNLAAEVNKGTFREDLYYRLAVVTVELPPLRSRREDIPLLVRHFLDRLRPAATPSEEMLQTMTSRPWRGNVRELRNAVERAVALMPPPDAGAESEDALRERISQAIEPLLGLTMKEANERLREMFERRYLEHVLALSGGSVSGAARLAEVNRRYLQRLMIKHNLRQD